MTQADGTIVGEVAGIWRHPVKSMLGEALDVGRVGEHGLEGDRQYALVDVETGRVVSAKNPKKWPGMFAFRAHQTVNGEAPGDVEIQCPDGRTVNPGDGEAAATVLTEILGRSVSMQCSSSPQRGATSSVQSEGYWPDEEWLDERRDQVQSFQLPEGLFFDGALIHLLTTATLTQLAGEYPAGRFDVRRFRPNFLIETAPIAAGYVENEWVGHRISLGEDVLLEIFKTTGRCVMTTLPQEDLPGDIGVLRTAVTNHNGRVGVYGEIIRGGEVRPGDLVRLG